VNEKYLYGNLRQEKLNQVLNGPLAKELRNNLLQDKPHEACQDCYNVEKRGSLSLRQEANRDFKDLWKKIEGTENDGGLIDQKLEFLDIRFSNICNFKCRSCNQDSSTSWGAELKKAGIRDHFTIERPTKTKEELWEILDQAIPYLRRVYFAGGEPLLEGDHYLFLEKLIEHKRTDVVLCYNSNFSSLKRHSKPVTYYWNQFRDVFISASLDGVQEQGELIRKGMKWSETVRNFKQLRFEAPRARFMVFPTISVLNAFHIIQALKVWFDIGMIRKAGDVNFNILNYPTYLNLNLLNDTERNKLKDHYQNFLREIKGKWPSDLSENVEAELNLTLNSLGPEIWKNERHLFRSYTAQLNKLRGESFLKLFPEYTELILEGSFNSDQFPPPALNLADI
jgi:sulfatase maturation enzyme AslB (radical SAM superfamily)